jgi:hypothetical protein
MFKNFIISVHIKVYKSNFFFVVSDYFGKVIFTKNSGSLGFINIQKRSIEALNSLLEVGLKEFLLLNKRYLFLKLEGLKATACKEIYKHLILFLKKNNIVLIGFKYINKIPFNGCRLRK